MGWPSLSCARMPARLGCDRHPERRGPLSCARVPERSGRAGTVVAVLAAADDAAVYALNHALQRWPDAARWTGVLAARLASVEVGLMLLLALGGGRRSALRMLAAV